MTARALSLAFIVTAVATLGRATTAQADSPKQTIAVMPFRDLAGGRPNIGAALRETLTVDLRQVPSVRVVEREAIDRVMREHSVDATRVLDGVLGVRVGTLIGATQLVTGAYQREGKRLRVTARIVAVETGVVVDAATVDGEIDRLLELEDGLRNGLLGQLGAPVVHIHNAARRPRLAAAAITLFGDAMLEPDAEKKKVLLRQAVAQSPQFSYAVDALAALEGRLSGYEQQSSVTFAAEERTQLAAARDAHLSAAARDAKIQSLLGAMRATRRYHALLAACDALADAPPASRPFVTFDRFVALAGLRRIDDALAAGEQLLATQPSSSFFAETETRLRALADERRTRAARVPDYDKDLKEKYAELGGSRPANPDRRIQWDWAPCIVARWHGQYDAHMLDGCRAFLATQGESSLADAKDHARAARLFVILALGAMGRFGEARQQIAEFRHRYPEGDDEIEQQLAIWPTD